MHQSNQMTIQQIQQAMKKAAETKMSLIPDLFSDIIILTLAVLVIILVVLTRIMVRVQRHEEHSRNHQMRLLRTRLANENFNLIGQNQHPFVQTPKQIQTN